MPLSFYEKEKSNDKLPFSKRVILAARYESYIVAILLFIYVWLDKDISSIVVLASLSWGGYRMVQGFYIWMCKHEHIMDKKLEYKQLGLDDSYLDEEEYTLDQENFDEEVVI